MTNTRLRVLIAFAVAAAGISALTVAGSAAPPTGHRCPTYRLRTRKRSALPRRRSSPPSCGRSPRPRDRLSSRTPNPAALTSFYGYQNDVVSADDPTKPQVVPTLGVPNEAQKTEPDKNTYLVFEKSLAGADPSYYYGTHFLYQGHENATTINGKKQGYITRINLDADAKHRVTLMATTRHVRPADRDHRRLDLGSRGPSGCCSRPRTRTRRRTRPRADYPVGGRRRLGLARPRRLRGNPERLGGQHLVIVEDIGGANKARLHEGEAARTASSTATSPRTPATCTTASCRCFRC